MIGLLGSLAQARPEAVTPDMLSSWLTFITDPRTDINIRSSIINILKSLAQSGSEKLTTKMFSSLFEAVTKTDTNTSISSDEVDLLKMLAQADPKNITSKELEKLIDLITNPQSNGALQPTAANILRALIQINPRVITPDMLPKLIENLTATNYLTRYYSAKTIGSFVRTEPKSLKVNMTRTLLTLLEEDEDSAGRYVVGYTLFEIAFTNPNQRRIIRVELGKLQDSPKPHLRMSANRILEMIEIGDLVNEARTHPDQVNNLKLRLQFIKNLPQSGTSNEREDGLSFAASVVLDEIDNINAKNAMPIADHRLTFGAGKLSATQVGILNPQESVHYKVHLTAGQTVSINLIVIGNEISWTVRDPKGIEVKKLDRTPTWSSKIKKNGDYEIDIIAVFGVSIKTYTLQVNIINSAK
jgi:hypothetical protein